MKQKLLCATDGSRASDKTVDWVIGFTKMLSACGNEVELAFLSVSTVSEDSAAKTHFWDAVVMDASNEQTFWQLHSANVRALKAGLSNVKLVTASGRNIAAAIIAFAETEKYDHVIMGSTGRTGVARMLIGSVASEVVAKAHCPVTVVR
jgi:nucleotide-binding universal stress UspA family protein